MIDPHHPDSRLDDLRQRLRRLGYLDAGVDRFVLAPARDARRPSVIAFFASIRIGLLAALLLGPTTVLALAARIPGLITGTRDAVVVALYLGTLFGAGIMLAAFLATLGAAWFGRRTGGVLTTRARGLSLSAGASVTILCLAYLTLWWQTASGGAPWSAPISSTVALLVAALISVLLGHAVTVTAFTVIVAGAQPPSSLPALPGTSWQATLLAGGLAFAAAAALLLSGAPEGRGDSNIEPITVVASGLRLRVIAVDGFDPAVCGELERQKKVPALSAALGVARAALRDTGKQSARRDPARIWTTIATGQPVERHRVYGLETRRVAGVRGAVSLDEPSALAKALRTGTDLLRLTRPSVASGSQRREKTFWEVASGAGLRTAVVNWWATWPAPADAGTVLTDRAALRLERGGDLDAEIAPAEVYHTLRQRWPAIKAQSAAQASDALAAALVAEEFQSLLQRSAELDAIQLALVAEVAGTQTDLTAVYLPGIDIVQYALLGEGQAIGPSAMAARLDAIRAYYVALDRLLSGTLSVAQDELLFLVTTPGRVAAGGAGVLGARGAAIASGRADASMEDVAPTILYALGLPVSRALQGAPLLRLFTNRFSARFPVRYVASYGRPPAQVVSREGQPLDREMIERLRSLGYVR